MVHVNRRADVQVPGPPPSPEPIGVATATSTGTTRAVTGAGQLEQVADVFDLLSDPRRLGLLVALIDGELCVGDLAAAIGASESATSHALRLLRAHRVVAARREGRQAYYRLTDEHVRQLLDVALAHVEHAGPLHDTGGGHQ
jgi:DNA-binding transcriptional ArsR family regulator